MDDAPIPWFRSGPSFSFTSTDSASSARASNARASRATRRSGRPSTDAPSREPVAVYAAPPRAADVSCLALAADGSVLLVGRADGSVEVVHTADGARGDFTQHSLGRAVRQVAVSADGRVGASAALDGTVRVFETDTLVQVALLRQTGYDWANGCSLSADGAVVVASFTPRNSDRAKIVRFDWAARRVTALWHGFHRVFELQASHDAKRVAYIRQGGVIVVMERGKTLHSVNYMKGDLDMAMDASGTRLVIADRELRMHTISDTPCQRPFYDYRPGNTRRVCLSADGNRVVVTSKRSLHVRDATTGAVLLALTHRYRITQCAFSADGTTIAASDSYGALVLWRPDLPKTYARTRDGEKFDLSSIRSCMSIASSLPLSPVQRCQQAMLTPLPPPAALPPSAVQDAPSLPSSGNLDVAADLLSSPSTPSPTDPPIKPGMQLVSVAGVSVPPTASWDNASASHLVAPSAVSAVDCAVPLSGTNQGGMSVEVEPLRKLAPVDAQVDIESLTGATSVLSIDVAPSCSKPLPKVSSHVSVDADDVMGAIRHVESSIVPPTSIGFGLLPSTRQLQDAPPYTSFPRPPTFPVLEPEMEEARQILRHTRK